MFSENLGLAADLFQGKLPCRDRVTMYANPMLLMGKQVGFYGFAFGMAFIVSTGS